MGLRPRIQEHLQFSKLKVKIFLYFENLPVLNVGNQFEIFFSTLCELNEATVSSGARVCLVAFRTGPRGVCSRPPLPAPPAGLSRTYAHEGTSACQTPGGACDQPARRPLYPRGSPCTHRAGQTPQSRWARPAIEKGEQNQPVHRLLKQVRSPGGRRPVSRSPYGLHPLPGPGCAPHPASRAGPTQETSWLRKWSL